MIRTMITALAVSLVLLTAPISSHAWLRAVSLGELTHDAAIIVLGRVTDVDTVDGIRVARLQVDRTLKGEAMSDVFFLAQATWTCDISDANVGESGLFFVSVHKFDENPTQRLESTPEEEHQYFGYVEFVGFREHVTALTGGQPLYVLTDSGCGRLVSKVVDGAEHLTYSHVAMPEQIRQVKLAGIEHGFNLAAPTIDVLPYVSQLAAADSKTDSTPRQATPN